VRIAPLDLFAKAVTSREMALMSTAGSASPEELAASLPARLAGFDCLMHLLAIYGYVLGGFDPKSNRLTLNPHHGNDNSVVDYDLLFLLSAQHKHHAHSRATFLATLRLGSVQRHLPRRYVDIFP